jgi:glycosyltransferase involved in cell wall biosynthesis
MKILFVQKVKALVGSEKYFLELIPELEKRGVETEFVCVFNSFDKEKASLFIESYRKLKLKIHVLEVSSDKSIVKTLKLVRKVVKNGNFDLVHSHLIHADLWMSILKRLGSVKSPIVSTKHGYDELFISKNGFDASKIKSNLYYKVCKFSEKKIKRSFAVSRGLRGLFVDSGICKAENIFTIHHGFDLPNINHHKNCEFRFSTNQIILLGRIIPFKGHKLAIESLIKVKQKKSDFKLLIIGHGDEDLIEDLKKMISDNDLNENVMFLGYKSNIYDYLNNSDVMLVPSIAEGFGLIFLEAMNAELPIIGFDVPATNEIIEHNVSGRIVPAYNTSIMANEIINLLENNDLNQKLSLGAKHKLLDYFCLDRMVSETINFYENALQK